MLTRDGRRNLGRKIASTNVARCCLIVLYSCGACLGCGPLRQDESSASESQRRPSKDSVPIVYQSERFAPIPLTPQQIDEFLSTASKAMPKGPSVWFILVRSNSKHDGDFSSNVIVYFRPNETTARLRKGRRLLLDSSWRWLAEIINTALRDQRKDDSGPSAEKQETDWSKRLRSYYQVSRADQPFGKKLEVPDRSLLPFDSPEGFTDEEVIDIVDFVRSTSTYTRPPSKEHPNSFSFPIQLDCNAPIVVIEKADDTFEVRTGTVEGPLSGFGHLLRIVRDGEDYRIIGTGTWVY